MIALARDGLLLLGVLASWLGTLALFRLRTPYQRLHCVAFVTVVGGFSFCLAVLLTHPGSPLGWKTVFLLLILPCAGAVVSHATGRAFLLRESSRERR